MNSETSRIPNETRISTFAVTDLNFKSNNSLLKG
jgi:hypothetical protein